MRLQIPRRTRRGIAALLLHAVRYAALHATPVALVAAPLTALLATPAAAEVWTQPLPVMALAGLGDVLAAATAGGVVLWDLSGLRPHVVTTAQGLPTQIALALCFTPGVDELDVATDNGIARGWFEGPWDARKAEPNEQGPAYYACLPRPGGFITGGDRGELIAWQRGRLDSLRIPTRSGRVVGLALLPDGFPSRRSQAELASTPVFPAGLVAALDNDGVWLLRSTGAWTRWLNLGDEMDGLPSRYTRAVLADARGYIWVATLAGVARISPALEVRSFGSDSLLSRRANTFLLGPDATLYVGLDIGLARIDDPDGPAPHATRIPAIPGPVVALASTDARLWWSDGQRVSSLAGDSLDWPTSIAANLGLAVDASRDTVCVGHAFGEASLRAAGSDWMRIGRAEGLPAAGDVRSFLATGGDLFVGTTAGLYVHAGSEPLRFVRVEGGPDEVSCQAIARGAQWAGGPGGLWKREPVGWTRVPLWSGANAIVDLASRGDTLWASAGPGGIAWSAGGAWVQPGRNPNLVADYFGRLDPAPDGRLAIATDRGLALWNGLNLEPVAGSPDAFLTDVAWWGPNIACGTYGGLWVRDLRDAWRMLGVTDGLPGAQIQSLSTDASGDLWIGTNRGIGRIPAIADDTPTDTGGLDTLLGGRASRGGFRIRMGSGSASWLEPGSIARVYDVRGRLLRSVEASRRGFEWTDERGRRPPHGVYFVQVRQPAGAVHTQRVVVLR